MWGDVDVMGGADVMVWEWWWNGCAGVMVVVVCGDVVVYL